MSAATVRAGISWQLILADLALILFMVTAGALSRAMKRGAAHAAAAVAPADQAIRSAGSPLAVFRDGPDAPRLARWLAAQPADPRQQLTVTAQYAPGGQGAALDRARARLAVLGPAGARARIVIEPGAQPLTASLAYDAPPRAMRETLARGLQDKRASSRR